MKQRKRRILYNNDGRHPHLHVLESPLTMEDWHLPIDELLGTMVDTLVFSLGGGNIFLHDTKAGTLWGELEEQRGGRAWNHLPWYRVSQSVRALLAEGLDPLRIMAERAHQKGLEFIASLRMNPPVESGGLGTGRLDRFRQDHAQYMIGESTVEGFPAQLGRCLDFSHEQVREERLAIIREVASRYPIDGFELDMEWPAFGTFFKPEEAPHKHQIMTDFVRQVKRVLDDCSQDAGRPLLLAVRLPATIAGCYSLGLRADRWIRDGLLDMVSPMSVQFGHDALIDVNLPVAEWVEAARGTRCQVYGCISGLVDDDRMLNPTVEMYRAAAANYWSAGVDGIHLLQFWSRGWPLKSEDYTVLREVGDPDLIQYRDKHYWVCSGNRNVTAFSSPSQLPSVLREASASMGARVRVHVADDIGVARARGTLVDLILRLRIENVSPKDELTFRLNDKPLVEAQCQRLDFTARLRSPIGALERRLGPHYVFAFDLTRSEPFPLMGWNVICVNLERRDPKFGAPGRPTDMVLNDVEFLIRYRLTRNQPTAEELERLVRF